MRVNNYKELIVWQKSIMLTEKIYKLTKILPADESKNIISQIKRASVSISSNIAEGYSRGSKNHYRQLLRVAYGSASELESQLELIRRLHLMSNEYLIKEINSLLLEVLKMLCVMIKNVS